VNKPQLVLLCDNRSCSTAVCAVQVCHRPSTEWVFENRCGILSARHILVEEHKIQSYLSGS